MINSVVVGANAATFTNLLAAFEAEYGADLLGCTVMRIRMTVNHESGGLIVLGIRTYDESSFATFAADDGPGTALHSDWMMWTAIPLSTAEVHTFDVRAMRKIEELNRSLLFSVSNLEAAGATFSAGISVLLALP